MEIPTIQGLNCTRFYCFAINVDTLGNGFLTIISYGLSNGR